MAPYLFVGERPSPSAARKGVDLRHGRFCAATLHAAIRAAGVPLERCQFINLWTFEGELRLGDVQALVAQADLVVGLGKRVQRQLRRAGIAHVKLVHPAARGRIRRTQVYQAHVAAQLAARSS